MGGTAVKLLAELQEIRGSEGAVGPDRPRFKQWLASARSQLEAHGRTDAVHELGRLPFDRLRGELRRVGALEHR